MLFRNLTLFRFPLSLRPSLETLDEKLPEHALKALSPLELSTRGFVSPFGRGHEALSHRVGDCLLLNLGGEDKILPASVVNEVLAEKLDAIREQEGRSPGGRERKRLKDEVLTDLLPRAFSKPTRTPAYLDLSLGWLVIDTAAPAKTDELIEQLHRSIDSLQLARHGPGAFAAPPSPALLLAILPDQFGPARCIGVLCHCRPHE